MFNTVGKLPSFAEFFEAPMGKSLAKGTQYNAVLAEYRTRYNRFLNDGEKKRHIELEGIYKRNNRYFLHLLVPSEADGRENLFYDVVIEFIDQDQNLGYSQSISRYKVRFFSNMLSFVYTYAHAYNLKGLLIPELKGKYQREIFSKKPKETNPMEIVNGDKSIFYVYYYLKDHPEYLSKAIYDSQVTTKDNLDLLIKKINTIDDVHASIAYADEKERNRKAEEKKKAKIAESKALRIQQRDEKRSTNGTKSSVHTIKAKSSTLSSKSKSSVRVIGGKPKKRGR